MSRDSVHCVLSVLTLLWQSVGTTDFCVEGSGGSEIPGEATVTADVRVNKNLDQRNGNRKEGRQETGYH